MYVSFAFTVSPSYKKESFFNSEKKHSSTRYNTQTSMHACMLDTVFLTKRNTYSVIFVGNSHVRHQLIFIFILIARSKRTKHKNIACPNLHFEELLLFVTVTVTCNTCFFLKVKNLVKGYKILPILFAAVKAYRCAPIT